MTLSMRHATWQQLSHEPRATINAIVDIRRMHLIAKIKTHGLSNNNKTYQKQNKKKICKPLKSVYNVRI